MNLDRKTMAGVSGVLVFALVLGLTSFSIDKSNNDMINKDNYGIHSSAGANGAINDSSNNIAAGANGAVDESVGVVDVEDVLVGQGQQYNTFGYTNLGLADVEGHLNIRKEASTSSSIVGKMTKYAACEILGESNGFYQITTGNAEGYVSKDYIITGEAALAIAQTEARTVATVTTSLLNVREKATTDSKVLFTVNKGEEVVVLEDLGDWLNVEAGTTQGYVSAEFVSVAVKLKTGNTMKELNYGDGVSNTRVNLVNYALKFVGTRYVWGGESLTKGIDCSGFTMKVYQKFGIKLPHLSRSQPAYGKKISRSQIRPGDLIFYGEGGSRITHVALYIGNDQIVHAAGKKSGVIISNAYYSKPLCIVSYLP